MMISFVSPHHMSVVTAQCFSSTRPLFAVKQMYQSLRGQGYYNYLGDNGVTTTETMISMAEMILQDLVIILE